MYKTIWIARTKKLKILAIWWRGCKQPFTSWRVAIKGLYPDCIIQSHYIFIGH